MKIGLAALTGLAFLLVVIVPLTMTKSQVNLLTVGLMVLVYRVIQAGIVSWHAAGALIPILVGFAQQGGVGSADVLLFLLQTCSDLTGYVPIRDGGLPGGEEVPLLPVFLNRS